MQFEDSPIYLFKDLLRLGFYESSFIHFLDANRSPLNILLPSQAS